MKRNTLPSSSQTRSEIEIIPLALSDGAWLQRLLDHSETNDIYARSAGYYGFTGRKGLSLISLGNSFAIAAAHPNQTNSRLLFSPDGTISVPLLKAYLYQTTSKITEIARVPANHADILAAGIGKHLNNWDIEVCEEDILDWKYPVHTLNTCDVSDMTGSNFTDFRKNIHRAERLGLESRALKMPEDILVLGGIVKTWADDAADRYGESEFLQDPYNYLLRNFNEFTPPIEGFIAYQGHSPIGFALWQIINKEKGEAASLATVQCHPQKGVSEYLYYEMCNRLQNVGITRVCIGGSETEGLDSFKRKMNPVASAALKTIKLSPR